MKGIFGFLASDDLRSRDPNGGSTGNYGIMDQRAAMQWTHDNIASFGGDPTVRVRMCECAGVWRRVPSRWTHTARMRLVFLSDAPLLFVLDSAS